ncbi:UNVERIFIED_CONTAM: hypothetical protein GTU68_034682 [Idotea baltica]|nr:hypothetical protein [Idotea baltica]
MVLDVLHLVVCAQPPHRNFCAKSEYRLAMAHLAVVGFPSLIVDDREFKRNKPSYTIDSLLSLRKELSADDQLFLVLGNDAFNHLDSWYRWRELLNYSHILVLVRPNSNSALSNELQEFVTQNLVTDPLALEGPNGGIAFVQQTPRTMSSTNIRARIAKGQSTKSLLVDSVCQYIRQHELYSSDI